jgi:hypothetical protein
MFRFLISLFFLIYSLNTFSQDLYPYGDNFPLGLYSLHTDLDSANYYGWNHGHRYGYYIDNVRYLATPMPDSYFEECSENKLSSFARLSWVDSLERKWSPSILTTINEIKQQEKHTNISWWDIPEELRYWKNSEYNIVKSYPQLIREYDTKNRPTYMYIPGHYSKEGVKHYVPFLDILPASCYPNYQGQPHVYVRWSIERTQEAIKNDGYILGKDYLNNKKTIIAILELFEQEVPLTKVGTWHDFWLALACNVKGIQVFSHFYRNTTSTLRESWNTLNNAIQLFKENKLDEMMIFGNKIILTHEILNGPKLAPTLNIQGETYSLPSIKILTKQYQDTLYIIVVNSANENVTFQIKDIPPLIIESKNILTDKTSTIKKQTIIDTLNSLGVAIYKIYTDKSEIKSIVFPSPSDGIVSIKITNSKITFNEIKIFNLHGNLIQKNACNYCLEKTILLNNIRNGTYIVQILRNNKCIATNKLIISN